MPCFWVVGLSERAALGHMGPSFWALPEHELTLVFLPLLGSSPSRGG